MVVVSPTPALVTRVRTPVMLLLLETLTHCGPAWSLHHLSTPPPVLCTLYYDWPTLHHQHQYTTTTTTRLWCSL